MSEGKRGSHEVKEETGTRCCSALKALLGGLGFVLNGKLSELGECHGMA